jgi:hypothetical protein
VLILPMATSNPSSSSDITTTFIPPTNNQNCGPELYCLIGQVIFVP